MINSEKDDVYMKHTHQNFYMFQFTLKKIKKGLIFTENVLI